MGAIFRFISHQIKIVPTADIASGDVVAVGGGLVGVAPTPIAANTPGYINGGGEYDVGITAGTAYNVGDYVTAAAVELDGTETTVVFGPAVEAVDNTATVVRCKLKTFARPPVTDETGGTAGTSLVAPAGSAYTTDELTANFATIAAALKL